MKLSHDFLLKILRWIPESNNETGNMWVIVQRPYDHLLNELRGVFKDQDEVVVKVDSRQEERRRREIPFSDERRQADTKERYAGRGGYCGLDQG